MADREVNLPYIIICYHIHWRRGQGSSGRFQPITIFSPVEKLDDEPFVEIRSPAISQHLPNVFLLAQIFLVFLTSGGRSNDHIRWVLTVVCGEHSSRNPSTVFLLIRGIFKQSLCVRRSTAVPEIGFPAISRSIIVVIMATIK